MANLHFLILYIKHISIFVFLFSFFVLCFPSFPSSIFFILFSFFVFSFLFPLLPFSILAVFCFPFPLISFFYFLYSLFFFLFGYSILLFSIFLFVILSVPVQLLKSGFVSASGMAIFANTPFAKTHSTKMCL